MLTILSNIGIGLIMGLGTFGLPLFIMSMNGASDVNIGKSNCEKQRQEYRSNYRDKYDI